MNNFEKVTQSKEALMEFAKLYSAYPNNALVDWDEWFSMDSESMAFPYKGVTGEYEGADGKWVEVRIFDVTESCNRIYASVIVPGGMILSCPVEKIKTTDESVNKRILHFRNKGKTEARAAHG